ncbi:hypothetical protein KN815_12260 [Streptomyces sp. 4503]|uniref:Uncharacterized protein n=1 Tax=Streptomyces niphimycinicus TaxID=2842201 RepID=A0ABS6CD46_9ACTN|nr:hypothetical protein [Streptomyces niphimycinicus]MBU3864822.1 hypothetical protein [Streptomyces niphimycinicus]
MEPAADRREQGYLEGVRAPWAEAQFEEHGGVFNASNLIKKDPTAREGE